MIIEDKELGEIRLKENPRAKRIIVKRKDDYLQLTYPSGITLTYIKKALEEMKPRLQGLINEKKEKYLFTPQSGFKTFSFSLNLFESSSTSNYYLKLKDGVLSIACPPNTDYQDIQSQNKIRELLEKVLRYEAKRLFPVKVRGMAHTYGFKVTDIKINKSRTRWGSCTSKKRINLSYYCMLLPEHLIDFVILHELCHTVEMNHGERFWHLLDKITDGQAKELTKELKSFKTNW